MSLIEPVLVRELLKIEKLNFFFGFCLCVSMIVDKVQQRPTTVQTGKTFIFTLILLIKALSVFVGCLRLIMLLLILVCIRWWY